MYRPVPFTADDKTSLHGRARRAANEAVAEMDLDDAGMAWFGEPVSLRWVLIHMIEENARHAGHLDILASSSTAPPATMIAPSSAYPATGRPLPRF